MMGIKVNIGKGSLFKIRIPDKIILSNLMSALCQSGTSVIQNFKLTLIIQYVILIK